MNKFFKLPEIM